MAWERQTPKPPWSCLTLEFLAERHSDIIDLFWSSMSNEPYFMKIMPNNQKNDQNVSVVWLKWFPAKNSITCAVVWLTWVCLYLLWHTMWEAFELISFQNKLVVNNYHDYNRLITEQKDIISLPDLQPIIWWLHTESAVLGFVVLLVRTFYRGHEHRFKYFWVGIKYV